MVVMAIRAVRKENVWQQAPAWQVSEVLSVPDDLLPAISDINVPGVAASEPIDALGFSVTAGSKRVNVRVQKTTDVVLGCWVTGIICWPVAR